ncbi:asparaginase [Poseidonocella sedimentorum]|uniref:L-asparaginase II n=1 Tax=Poseidonocella sedimentorum TaxID=871652 RepID=A0A1I6CQB2_9RHOB|nr:asparaginase [Poseidonocella sedimentorum]SFQ95354.1 L-asparaginase II [Poseidonocella sedimentorum]
MSQAEALVEVWRGDFLECVHRGHAVVCDGAGEVVAAWGDPGAVILPRSSVKVFQALPLVASGAADRAGLTDRHLALACASHSGAFIHNRLARSWLRDLGFGPEDLLCGAQSPQDRETRHDLIRHGQSPDPTHHNCSGKHCGFLTLRQHLGAGPDYVDPAHPVQRAVRELFEEVTGAPSPGYGIDGCAAPNFATTVTGLARGAAWIATAGTRADALSGAGGRLAEAMMAHPELVAGEGRACTALMRAAPGAVLAKTGAEGVYLAALPNAGLGIGLKIEDGATRASECAVAALLARLGALDPEHPAVQSLLSPAIHNQRGDAVGAIRPAAALM